MNHEIRSKIKNGVTLQEICQEYKLTFAEVFDMMKRTPDLEKRNKPHSTTGFLYISIHHGRFKLRKNDVNYGMFETLEDAVKVRDYFIYNGWNKRKLDEVCKKVGVKRCVHHYDHITERHGHFFLRGMDVDGKYKVFGTYNSLDDAVKVREYCNKHGWKRSCIDKYCEILQVERVCGAYELKYNKSLYGGLND